ncbi:MAG: methylmalonyl Co-A mutase-associated GTPase MeaB [Planctomycetota bacterium]|jgi:LAO/AO transport system kinase
MSSLPTKTELADGIRRGDRTLLARAITLVESTRADHHDLAQDLLTELLPETGKAARIGVTGVPGVGKSTFLDAFGMELLGAGYRVAVLAVDPSSTLSGGSILGDKARMARLALEDNAFIRPSPSGATLGGVARRTRESMLLCEAAGFDVVLIETVGVGQSETVVADMVDFFLVLMLPGAGDELQGIKKGILELADVIAVNKADGENLKRAEFARRNYASALHYLQPRHAAWHPQAVSLSGLTGEGLAELWTMIQEHRTVLEADGSFAGQRQRQMGRWMWAQIEERLLDTFRGTPAVQERLAEVERKVLDGDLPPTAAADLLLSLLR